MSIETNITFWNTTKKCFMGCPTGLTGWATPFF